LFARQLGHIRLAERQAAEVFPDMAVVATDEAVASVFRSVSSETEVQLARLQRLAESNGVDFDHVVTPTAGERSVEALLAEAKRLVSGEVDGVDGDFDLKLVSAARRSVTFQLAGYEALCATARRLGDYAALDVLLQSLDDELSTDASLAGFISDSMWILSAS
jgi:ferritin-like metal-binding protein YciE